MSEKSLDIKDQQNMRYGTEFAMSGYPNFVVLKFQTTAPNDPDNLLPNQEVQIAISYDHCEQIGRKMIELTNMLSNKGKPN